MEVTLLVNCVKLWSFLGAKLFTMVVQMCIRMRYRKLGKGVSYLCEENLSVLGALSVLVAQCCNPAIGGQGQYSDTHG